jgi:RimJ/RimL family protein N-acetyltransferase
LNLRRLSSAVVEFNKRSIRMHEKLGFVEEGRRRKATYVNGRFWDDLVFGLLREEWTPVEY